MVFKFQDGSLFHYRMTLDLKLKEEIIDLKLELIFFAFLYLKFQTLYVAIVFSFLTIYNLEQKKIMVNFCGSNNESDFDSVEKRKNGRRDAILRWKLSNKIITP